MTVIGLSFLSALNANPLDLEYRSQITVHDHYSAMIEHYQNQDWQRLCYRSLDLIQDFPESPFAREAYYYLGFAYFQLQDYEMANIYFSKYLKEELTPKFFDQVIRYKFEIACKFEEGAKRHVFGWERMPKWFHAYEEAIEIYDEVITTLPRDDLAAQSLYRKGNLLLIMEEYKKSIEAYQTLIRRFPKHPLTPECFLGIANVYNTKCEKEFPDPNDLEQALINLRRFRSSFPGEPRLELAEKELLIMKEKFAAELYEIGEFYKRTKKYKAAAIYYATILKRFPETSFAERSQKRLDALDVSEVEALFKKQSKKQEEAIIVESEEQTPPPISEE